MSFFGTWKLNSLHSDLLPPIYLLGFDIPLSSQLIDRVNEKLTISKQNTDGIEEIVFNYKAGVKLNYNIVKYYQLNKLNIERYPNNVIGSIIIPSNTNISDSNGHSDINYNCLSIVRYGCTDVLQSSETFTISEDNLTLQIIIEVSFFNGFKVSLTKYLNRVSPVNETRTSLNNCLYLYGWFKSQYHDSNILKQISIKIVDVWHINSPSSANCSKHIPLTDYDLPNDQVLYITKRIGDMSSNGEKVTVYVIKLTCGSKSWYVIHRYKQFHALHLFISETMKYLPKKYLTELKNLIDRLPITSSSEETNESDHYLGPNFPPKSIFKVLPHHRNAKNRAIALEKYLSFHLKRGGHDILGIIDMLAAFLEIPENMQRVNETAVLNNSSFVDSTTVSNNPKRAASPVRVNNTVTSTPVIYTSANNNILSSPVTNRTTTITANSSVTNSQTVASEDEDVIISTISTSYTLKSNDLIDLSLIIYFPINQLLVLRSPDEALQLVLSRGLKVIKHGNYLITYQLIASRITIGRTGKPKQRLLQCDDSLQRIYWQEVPVVKANSNIASIPLPKVDKSFLIDDITAVHRCIDTTTNNSNYQTYSNVKNNIKISDIFNRSKLSNDKLQHCVTFVLSNRTVDIECLTKQDFEFLFYNFSIYLDRSHLFR